MNEREGDWESMNNFHCHMPGGLYRPDPIKGFLPRAMRECLEEFAPFIDSDESAWPEGVDRELVRTVRTKRDIQRVIDQFLESNPHLANRYYANQAFFGGGGTIPMREWVLRPIYTALRERFSEDELSS